MSIFNRIRQACFCHFSGPQPDRPVYQAIRQNSARNILELGVGDGQRALQMMKIAKMASPEAEIRYIGIDLFEGRSESDGPGMSFKTAHQCLRADGCRVQLLPGEPAATFVRMANSLGKVDVLVLPAKLASPDFNRMWFFVPRVLHENSMVFVERTAGDGQTEMCLLSRAEIGELAKPDARRRAA